MEWFFTWIVGAPLAVVFGVLVLCLAVDRLHRLGEIFGLLKSPPPF